MNNNLFKTTQRSATGGQTRNKAGGRAVALPTKEALAQMVCTTTFSDGHYSSGDEQLEQFLRLTRELVGAGEFEFLSKLAAYGRKEAGMKDAPVVLLAAMVSMGNNEEARHWAERAFPYVVDNGKQLRTLFQVIRSGVTGRRAFGSFWVRLMAGWINSKPDWYLMNASVGNNPSLADVIRMVHPKPANAEREELYGWILGKESKYGDGVYPETLNHLLDFRAGLRMTPPRVDFRLLTATDLNLQQYREIAKGMNWTALRMNLNALHRHGVFGDNETVREVAGKLRNPDMIQSAHAMPFQLFMAWKATANTDMPADIRQALQIAVERSLENCPVLSGKVYVCPDVSGSMRSPVTGRRANGNDSAVRCIDAAAILAAGILQKNPYAKLLPFSNYAFTNEEYDRNATVMANAERLSRLGGGGTNYADPLVKINEQNLEVDTVVYISDMQSWMEMERSTGPSYGIPVTETIEQWKAIKARCPNAKAIHINVASETNTQAEDDLDTINIGGYGDSVFRMMKDFVEGGNRIEAGFVERVNSFEF